MNNIKHMVFETFKHENKNINIPEQQLKIYVDILTKIYITHPENINNEILLKINKKLLEINDNADINKSIIKFLTFINS